MSSSITSSSSSTFVGKVQTYLSQWFEVGLHKDHRSPQQLEREKYVFYSSHYLPIRFQRWMMIVPVLLVQCCVGSFYSSSIFNKYMDTHVWDKIGANAGMFTSCVFFYGFGTFLFGSWIGRHGVFRAVSRTLILTPLGWLLAYIASTNKLLPLLYLGYGICHGLGCAHAYIATTSALQQFYPDLKGFISGLAVMGAGVGSYLFTSLGRYVISYYHMEPPAVQLLFAIICVIVISVCLPFLRNPPPNYKPEPIHLPDEHDTSHRARFIRWFYSHARTKTNNISSTGGTMTNGNKDTALSKCNGPRFSLSRDRNYTFSMAMKEQEFVLTSLLVIGQCITGAVFLSSAADMVQNIFGKDASSASLVTSWLNLVNFVGRFAYGFVTDKIGRKGYWLFSSLAQSIALITMTQIIPLGAEGFSYWLICFLFIGSLYGGTFGVLAAFVSDLFGPKISSAVHGFAIAMWALSTIIGVPIFTSVTNKYSILVDTTAKIVSSTVVTNSTNSSNPFIINGNTTSLTPLIHTFIKVPTPEAYIINATWLTIFPLSAFIITLFLNVRAEDRILRKILNYEGRGKPLPPDSLVPPYSSIPDTHGGCGSAMVRLPLGYLCTCSCHCLHPKEQEYEYERIHAREIVQNVLLTVPVVNGEAKGTGEGGEGEGGSLSLPEKSTIPDTEQSGEIKTATNTTVVVVQREKEDDDEDRTIIGKEETNEWKVQGTLHSSTAVSLA